jgi:hypothetical protein
MAGFLTCSIFMIVGVAAVLHLRPGLPRHSVGWFAGAFLAGVGATGSLLFLLALLGIPVTRAVIWGIVAVALLLIFGRREALLAAMRNAQQRRSRSSVAGLLLIALPFVAALYGMWGLPAGDYDGRTTWLPKAAAIADEHSIDGPFFQGERGLNLHNHYPLLVPLDVAAVMLIAGTGNVDVARPLYFLIPLAFLLFVYESVQERLEDSAWVIALAAWLPPWIVAPEGGVSSTYADLTTAAFFGAAVLAASDGREPHSARSVGLWLTFLILTKSEGLVLAVALIGALAVCGRIKHLATAAQIVAGPLAAVAALAIWRARVPEAYDHRYQEQARELFDKLPRIGEAAKAFFGHAFSLANWGFVWPAIVAASLWSMVRRRDQVPVLAVFGAALTIVLTYTITTWSIEELASVSANRLLTQLLVPGLLILANTIAEFSSRRAIGSSP